VDWLVRVLGRAQAAGLYRFFDKLANFSFHDWRLAAINELNLLCSRVNAEDLMSLASETPC
jgi:hypothetical protein